MCLKNPNQYIVRMYLLDSFQMLTAMDSSRVKRDFIEDSTTVYVYLVHQEQFQVTLGQANVHFVQEANFNHNLKV
jgi:hypothetical protein